MGSLLPSQNFLERASRIPGMSRLVQRVVKELEIYSYFAEKIPKRMEDAEWDRICRINTSLSRVNFLENLAVAQKRSELDKERKDRNNEYLAALHARNKELHESGMMAYGKDFNTIALGHRDKDTNHVNGARIWASARTGARPMILLDFQFVGTYDDKDRRKLCKQAEIAICEQYKHWSPFPMAVINADTNNRAVQDCLYRNMIIYNTLHTEQKMLPDVFPDNPYLRPNSIGKENIVYISKHAPPMDGPLMAGAYVIPITLDRRRESVGASRQQGYIARSLPLDKYVVWKFGPRFIPFCNIVKILNDVASSGGDWERALRRHIASYRLTPPEEHPLGRRLKYERLREGRRLKNEITSIIDDSLGVWTPE